ncbi:family 20 glycosylhydrolase [Verrucomicrobiaceae bacterium 227]
MNSLKTLVLVGLTLLPIPSFGAPQILPAPKTMEAQSGSTDLASWIQPVDGTYLSQATALGKALASLTGSAPKVGGDQPENTPAIRLIHDAALSPEGYELESAAGLTLKASTPTGMAHATATVLQLLEKNDAGKWQLPKVHIKDQPDFSFRCFLVDMGRNPHSPGTLRRTVDMMWLAKANFLHLHLTDDQLFSFPSTAFPKLLSKNAGWTLDDWREMEAYSQARGVTIIPEFEVPGHSGILRRIYPEVFGKTATDLATLDSAFEGTTTILTEMMDVFKASPYIHVGGDEAYGVDEQLQRTLINKLNKFVKSKGRRTLVWEGPRPGKGKNKVDEDVIHMNWRSHEFPPAEMIKAGHTIINATWDPLYIVDHYPRTMFTAVSSRDFYNFNIKRFKHVNHQFPTYDNPQFLESTDQVLGFCLPWWEGREENIFPICRQRLNAVTARTWNDKGESSFESFLARDKKLKTLLDTLRPWTGSAPTGGWADRMEEPAAGNLAHGKPVSVSVGASQPLFHPQRLTNGATDRFDHFLGYPTVPKALEITIDLGAEQDISRVEVFEAAVGQSWEQYEIASSTDNKSFTAIGKTEKGTRGDKNSVTFKIDSRKARYLRIKTDGCQDLTFPSFSRLCEVMVFEK